MYDDDDGDFITRLLLNRTNILIKFLNRIKKISTMVDFSLFFFFFK